jgi:hypothetical protein
LFLGPVTLQWLRDFGGPTERVHLVGVSISFEKNFYRLPFTPPLSGRLIGSSAPKGWERVTKVRSERTPIKRIKENAITTFLKYCFSLCEMLEVEMYLNKKEV